MARAGLCSRPSAHPRRPVGLAPNPATIGDAAAHLHQTVEAAPRGPWSGPAIRAQADIDQAGPEGTPKIEPITEAIERAWAVAMHDHIAVRQQRFEPGAISGLPQIKTGAILTERDLRHHAGFIPIGRIDPQHAGTEAGEKTGRNRAGQNPGQIKHFDAGQRTGRCGLPVIGAMISRSALQELPTNRTLLHGWPTMFRNRARPDMR